MEFQYRKIVSNKLLFLLLWRARQEKFPHKIWFREFEPGRLKGYSTRKQSEKSWGLGGILDGNDNFKLNKSLIT